MHGKKHKRKRDWLNTKNGLQKMFTGLNDVETSAANGLGISATITDDACNNLCNNKKAKLPIPESNNDENGWIDVTRKGIQPPEHKTTTESIKRQKNKKASLVIEQWACPSIDQVHRLILSTMSGYGNNLDKWYRLSGFTHQSASRFLLVIVPYVEQKLIEKYSGSCMPFLHRQKHNVRSGKRLFIRGSSSTCSILEGILAKKPDVYLSDNHVKTPKLLSPTDNTKEPDYGTIRSMLLNDEDLADNGFSTTYINWNIDTSTNPAATEQYNYNPIIPPNMSPLQLNLSDLQQSELEILMKDPDFPHLLGLDCEMCETEIGKEVVKLSLVRPKIIQSSHPNPLITNSTIKSDEPPAIQVHTYSLELDILINTLVAPSNPVIDYLTKYSGVTGEHLSNISISLNDVHVELKKFIKPESILVGHSINHDLDCLHIFHPQVIDTSILFPHPYPPMRHSLKHLAYTYLNRRVIQQRSCKQKGHDPIEDAQIPIELTLLKTVRASKFGGTRHQNIPSSLGKLLEQELILFDPMLHDVHRHPLCYFIDNVKVSNLGEQTDASAVRHCIHTLKGLPHNILFKNNIQSSTDSINNELSSEEDKDAPVNTIPRLHICILRDYQKLCHEAIGGISTPYQPNHMYNISRRINQFVATCLSKAIAIDAKPIISQQTITEVNDNWLHGALNNSNQQETPTTGTSSTDIASENEECVDDEFDMDDCGKLWATRLVQQCPIRDPSILFPHIPEKNLKNILKDIDNYLMLLYNTLEKGDLFCVLSMCGNPIPSLGLGCLEKCLEALKDGQHWATMEKFVQFNELFKFQKANADCDFNKPFSCILLK